MELTVLIEPCPEGGFHVRVPSLPGSHSEGETEAEALRNLVEAVELYLAPDDVDLTGARAKAVKAA